MNGGIDRDMARQALANMPEGTSYGERPTLKQVYLPRSHAKALDMNNPLVTGMRGAGKTFWWSALQEPSVRQLVGQSGASSTLDERTEVRIGFGLKPAIDDYPSKDVLHQLMNQGIEPRIIWRTVQARQLAPGDHPIRQQIQWPERTVYVKQNPETIDRLFQQRDEEFDRQGTYFLLLFDALDRCADDWKEMYPAIRGLLQNALDWLSYRRLRVKVFLRSDQIDENEVADFPDASKVLASSVELNWPRNELYGLLWHYLANGQNGGEFQTFLAPASPWPSVEVGSQNVVTVPRPLREDRQREKFHDMAGPWMGRGPKRGFPYTWIPNHLGDTEGRVSPRSFLKALRMAAEDTADQYPDHDKALHFESIKRGVQEASRTRVAELREDYPWVDKVLQSLHGMVVPCEFAEIEARWNAEGVLDRLTDEVDQNAVKLPPSRIDRGANGVREDLESLRVFWRAQDDRVNIPDVFRVGYGLGRRGGVKPAK